MMDRATGRNAIAVMIFVLVSGGAVQAAESKTISGQAFGTTYRLTIGPSDHDVLRSQMHVPDIAELVAVELERIDSIFSLYRPDSEIAQWNALPAGEWFQASHDLCEVLAFAMELSRQTDGAYDPTVRTLSQLWNLHSVHPEWSPPGPASIEATMQVVGCQHIELDRSQQRLRKVVDGVQLDLNSLAEGWAIDCLLDRFTRSAPHAPNMESLLFELGGEFGARGVSAPNRAWRIGIEDPLNPRRLVAKLSLRDSSLCTSGTYKQGRVFGGKRYSHILNARTGAPVRHSTISVSVLHARAMVADGWATALLILGGDEAIALAERHALKASFVFDDVDRSPALTSQARELFELTDSPSVGITGGMGIMAVSLVMLAIVINTICQRLALRFRRF
jgi:FAD:protein FMN transferase